MLFPTLEPSSLPVGQLDEILATEQLLCWSGITETEHTTSGSNEEKLFILPVRLHAILLFFAAVTFRAD